jgi:LmbE family N-acetylglucosaminyl deacetylase
VTAKTWETGDLPNRLLVMAPHPDDEVLGCGRLMRRVQATGGQVVVAWLTDGGSSHGELPPQQRRELVARRQAEALEGLRAMGVTPAAFCFLGYPDGGLGAVDPLDPERRLQVLCDTHRSDTVVVTDVDDGHPDHRAAFAIARRLMVKRLFSFPVSARYDGEPYTPPAQALLLAPESGDDKRVALGRHLSQREDAGARFPLTAATIERFCVEPEVFIPIPQGGL